MNTLLATTDFSEIADNAIDYAAGLAHKVGAKLILMHVYWVPIHEDEEIDTVEDIQVRNRMTNEEKNIQQDTLARLDRISSSLKAKYQQLEIEYKVSNGLAVDEIVSYCSVIKPSLVVMGTHGVTGIQEAILGSTATAVMERCPAPLLLIPANISWQNIKNLTFATDFEASDVKDISKIAEIASAFNAAITVIHVHESSFWEASSSKDKLEKLKLKINQEVNYQPISFIEVKSDNFIKSINEFSTNNHTDILAMTTQKKSLLQRFMGGSLTQEVAQRTNIPLLTFNTLT